MLDDNLFTRKEIKHPGSVPVQKISVKPDDLADGISTYRSKSYYKLKAAHLAQKKKEELGEEEYQRRLGMRLRNLQ